MIQMRIINKMCLSLGMEIKAQDLRIGNLIDYFGKVKTVIRISKENSCWYVGCSDKITDLMNCWNVQDSYGGIPLTEEWLLKMDAIELVKLSDGYVRFDIDGVRLSISPDDRDFFVEYVHKIQMRYLHQFQNYYFAIKQTELTIK